MRHLLRWLPALLLATVIYVLSIGPSTAAPGTGTALFGMTARHALAYAALAASLAYGFRLDRARLPHAVVLAAVFGTVIEVHQLFLPHRFFSLVDIGANLAGAASVLILAGVPPRYLDRYAL